MEATREREHETLGTCRTCGKRFPYALLDSKPEPENRPDPEGVSDWTFLECQQCYGPGWLPL